MTTSKKSKKLKWIKHYNSNQKILLVGEGDFSFSACLARAFGSATNMVATTSHSSRRTLLAKHWTSEAHLEFLEEKGCLVLHGIDVHNMNSHQTLSQLMKFDVIIFNFPHAGHFPPLRESDGELIKMHQMMVKAFFGSAREMVSEGGEVHVTHRDDNPYNQWNLKELAEDSGLVLKEKVEFLQKDYPGYHNKRGGEIKSNKKFPLGVSYTFKFSVAQNSNQMSKINADEEEEEEEEEGGGDLTSPLVALGNLHLGDE